ncbi:MAG: M50 family metallopeptidase [Nanoarchaeota archaeon]|nr:M50 family metallopeptidase [Nanoarchaeota archaeon]
MTTMIYLLGKIIWIYVAYPAIVREIKVPPIMPLIPYLPQVFKLDFLPPFYFTYWIVILAIIAITHEFAHGIFAAYNKIKIKTTGFGFFPFFLPVFLAAFVELDEKKMEKKSIFSQMAILSAGTFANILTAILFLFLMFLFFSLMFTPAGIIFNTYTYSAVKISDISEINGVELTNPSYEKFISLIGNQSLNEIKTNDFNYVGVKSLIEGNYEYVILYDDSPAINLELKGAIIEFGGVKINNWEDLGEEIIQYSPGDEVSIKTKVSGEIEEYKVILGESPEDKNTPRLGIGFENYERSGIIGKILNILSSFKKSNIYYEPKFDGFSEFIYNLLWWIALISISVALVNMLPMGIFDGGRFFYLTILALTKNEKKAKRVFSFSTYILLFLFLILMIFWGVSFFK